MSLIAKLAGNWDKDIGAEHNAIIQHICSLISSRAPLWHLDAIPPATKNTIAFLGLSYVTRYKNEANIAIILANIRRLIQSYEPRLSQVSVELSDTRGNNNNLPLMISATVNTKFGKELVVFEPVLNFSSNSINLRKSGFA
ncbi:GPW/gp25 family protein [Parashewanella tropica]|uniref:GPW/gp25 family protein n=1 Tax=Parashewanella tropica TaxID=2547970 RepID=UPI00105A290C|nr:GPW/gp25 family protein [Parashewanella tropica]